MEDEDQRLVRATEGPPLRSFIEKNLVLSVYTIHVYIYTLKLYWGSDLEALPVNN